MRRRTRTFRLLLAAVLGTAMLLGACAPQQDRNTASNDQPQQDSGGIGGTGTGTVTATATVAGTRVIELDGRRRYDVVAGTRIMLDGEALSKEHLSRIGDGMVARVDVGLDAAPDLTAGTAVNVDATWRVKGPVTSLEPLRVLGQDVLITTDTVLAPSPHPGFNLGDEVRVSGYAGPGNAIQATRVELTHKRLSGWAVTGRVGQLYTGNRLRIGNLDVAYHTGDVDCPVPLDTGLLVRVSADTEKNFSAGDTLHHDVRVRCESTGLTFSGEPRVVPVEVSGVISDIVWSLTPPWQFTVNEVTVLADLHTRVDGEDLADVIFPGAHVEVAGTLDTATGIVTAEEIDFHERQVRLKGPLLPEDVVPGESLVLMGVEVRHTVLTQDPEGLLATGISGERQVEVRGFMDGSGRVYATEVEDKGEADYTDVRLRGPAYAVPGAFEFTVLGITVSSAGADLQAGDDDDDEVSAGHFFAELEPGAEVEVRGGTYDPATHTITNAREIRLRD